MTTLKTQILAVDDDISIVRLLKNILEQKDYQVTATTKSELAMQLMEEKRPELVILDILMPKLDGYQVCRQIRQRSNVPIIMLTSKNSIEDKLAGLSSGADDYITKPFHHEELIARVNALLRRCKDSPKITSPNFVLGDLKINYERNLVTVAGKDAELTATEFRILLYLAQNSGCILTSTQILRKVWGEEYKDETHMVRVNIYRLRRKLGDLSKKPKYIVTKTGIGYMISNPMKLVPSQMSLL